MGLTLSVSERRAFLANFKVQAVRVLNLMLGLNDEQIQQLERLKINKGKGHRVVGRGTLVADADKICSSSDFKALRENVRSLIQ